MRRAVLLLFALLVLVPGCGPGPGASDGGVRDAGVTDAGPTSDAGVMDAGPTDAGPTSDAGAPDGGPTPDAGAPDAGPTDAGPTDGGAVAYPDWPPLFISAFGLSYDGPVASGGDVWVDLTVARPDALAALGAWSFSSANYDYVYQELTAAEVPFALAAGDVIRVHGAGFAGTTDRTRADNDPDVWDVVSEEPFGPSFKHGLLWLAGPDGAVLDAVVYETGLNQGDWLTGDALAQAEAAVAAGEWPSPDAADAVRVADPDREWARLSPPTRAGDAAADWQIVGATLETYYERAAGLTGDALKAALHAIVKDHVVIPYSEVASVFTVTDADPADPTKVIQFYTGRPTTADFNKEHVWAKSHGGFDSDAYAGYSDVHALRPTRPDVNSVRWHLDFDEGGTPYSDSGCNLADGLSFEPRDAVKGDVARALFYMAVRYEGDDPPMPDLELVEDIPSLLDAQGLPNNDQHTSTPRIGRLSTLLRWHVQDPPDDGERRRNDLVFERFQRNRNPFVDHPEWVHAIWGGPAWPAP